jgi:hypothetical protein
MAVTTYTGVDNAHSGRRGEHEKSSGRAQRRERLKPAALLSGEQLYRAKPRDWKRQLERYWIR